MASKETWDKLEFFRSDSEIDKWGNVNEISDVLLCMLDDFRRYIGIPMYVLRGVATEGHSRKSYHYVEQGACAVDVIIPKYEGNSMDLIIDATRFGFRGIGYYPHWRWDNQTCGGLHLDCRPLRWDDDATINYKHSRWMGILRDGKQEYIPLTFENLRRYGV